MIPEKLSHSNIRYRTQDIEVLKDFPTEKDEKMKLLQCVVNGVIQIHKKKQFHGDISIKSICEQTICFEDQAKNQKRYKNYALIMEEKQIKEKGGKTQEERMINNEKQYLKQLQKDYMMLKILILNVLYLENKQINSIQECKNELKKPEVKNKPNLCSSYQNGSKFKEFIQVPPFINYRPSGSKDPQMKVGGYVPVFSLQLLLNLIKEEIYLMSSKENQNRSSKKIFRIENLFMEKFQKIKRLEIIQLNKQLAIQKQ